VRELRSHEQSARSRHRNEVLDESHLAPLISFHKNIHGGPLPGNLSLESGMKDHITFVPRLNKGNFTRTASALEIPRTTLKDKMKNLDIRII
jgi:DNA-binding NtrC family response regulator